MTAFFSFVRRHRRPLGSWMDQSRPRCWGLGWLGLMLAGCGDPAAIRPADIRVYRTAKEAVASSLPPVQEAGRSPAVAIRYQAPPGWTDRGGSGIRLATLMIGAPEDGHEVTVIPASGSLEANVARWLGQLDPQATPEVLAERAGAALTAAETVAVGSDEATVVVLGNAAPPGDEAAGEGILAGVIPLDGTSSLFVKFKGPATIVHRELDNFRRFVASIRRD
jgi:hypothetical protein